MGIIKTPLTAGNEILALQNSYKKQFELTDYEDNATLELAGGRAEEIGGYLYFIESGDYVITDDASDGTAYVYIEDSGDGTAEAELTNDNPTWDGNKGGYYYGAKKAVFFCRKGSGIYTQKAKVYQDFGFLARSISPDTIYTDEIFEKTTDDGVTVDGLVIKDSKIDKTGLKAFWKAATQTDGTWFTDWSVLVPTVGDYAMANGARDYTSTPKLIYALYRSSTTRIVMYYQDSSTSVAGENYDSGATTNRTIAISV